MTTQLIAISIGPVQELIVAARRTRDLWFGSYLLSEISKAAARSLADHGVTLIFPAPTADLAPGSAINVSNVIIGEIKDGDPATLAGQAKTAAQARWREFADLVRKSHQAVLELAIWDEQVDDIVEFYAAWHPSTPATYRADRAAVMRLLQSRKQCRDFLPGHGRAGVWKSSLDGLRESVLIPRRTAWPQRSRRRFHLSEGEQLDVLGTVKRVWAPSQTAMRYPSVARVAADPWLRGLAPAARARLGDACRALVEEFDGDLIHEIETTGRGHAHYASFPYEGTAVYRSRYQDLTLEAEVALDKLAPLAAEVDAAVRVHGEPSPYLAVVVADGDRMGSALAWLASADAHRAFSTALARFAEAAREIFDQHRGVLVYAGGDDVMGLVPVDQAVTCARALHDRFSEVLAPWNLPDAALTLSVGVAIAHFMEPFEDLLSYARDAERHAKTPRRGDGDQPARDGLALHVVKRGGAAVELRATWPDRPDRQLAQLAQWLVAGAVPSRAAHDLHAIAGVYDGWPDTSVADAIQRDAIARLRAKRPAGVSKIAEIEAMIQGRVTSANALRCLADQLLIAQQLASATRQADGGPGPAGTEAP